MPVKILKNKNSPNSNLAQGRKITKIRAEINKIEIKIPKKSMNQRATSFKE